jgi:ubiquinone/menaquinone biosynthesis C-methylase UbiE
MPQPQMNHGTEEWGSDFFGGLNEMPPEPVAGIGHVLEAMATQAAFRDARQWVLANLGVPSGGSILEAGCGNAAHHADLHAIVGPRGRIVGIDPTKAFIESAQRRSKQQGPANATYEIGDIRALPCKDGEFDAAFCDKVLIHAGPASAALREMARVTRPGRGVGAIEWLPLFAISATDLAALAAFNAIFPIAVYEFFVSVNLARHFHAAGLQNIRTHAFLAQTTSLDEPFWRAFIVHQMPMFIQAGLIEEAQASAFLSDIEALNAAGTFSASFIVQAATGTKSLA